jgi:rhodanese-related sulfurtransferase
MPITKGSQQLVAEATARITTRSVTEAQALMGDDHYVLVDLRDPRELER